MESPIAQVSVYFLMHFAPVDDLRWEGIRCGDQGCVVPWWLLLCALEQKAHPARACSLRRHCKTRAAHTHPQRTRAWLQVPRDPLGDTPHLRNPSRVFFLQESSSWGLRWLATGGAARDAPVVCQGGTVRFLMVPVGGSPERAPRVLPARTQARRRQARCLRPVSSCCAPRALQAPQPPVPQGRRQHTDGTHVARSQRQPLLLPHRLASGGGASAGERGDRLRATAGRRAADDVSACRQQGRR